MAKNPRMSEAAKRRAAAQARAQTGQFAVQEIISTAPVTSGETSAVLPPRANVDYQSIFISPPAPVANAFYNPDQAFLSNPENASRMIQDLAILGPLQERQLATAALPWSIIPEDEEDEEQVAAAKELTQIVRGTPNLPDLFRNLLDAIWFGRMGATMRYEWDFSTGRRRMKATAWTPVHGDTLVFLKDGKIGYKVGVPPRAQAEALRAGVIGQFLPVSEEPLMSETPDKDGNCYLEPVARKAWVVHHHRKTAGEYRLFTSAAAMYGLGLRSYVYPTWVMKMSALQFYMNAAEKFGSGWIVGYFDGGNPKSATAVKTALEKQVGSCVQMFPRFAPESESIEGLELVDPPSGGYDGLMNAINYFDKQLRLLICGQEMTADNEQGAGMGSNMAEVQQSTFGRLIKYDAAELGETITEQFVSVLQEFNGFGHLPKMRFEFSHDIGSTKDKIENAERLHAMGCQFDTTELVQECGFTPIEAAPITTKADENGEVIDTTGMLPDAGKETPEEDESGNEFEDNND